MQLFSIVPAGGSYTLRFLGAPLVAVIAITALALWRRRRRFAAVAGAGAILIGAVWLGLYLCRPRWVALTAADPTAPATLAAPAWVERAPGLETADVEVVLAGHAVDVLALVRIDPARYDLTVHWAGAQPLTAEDWQSTLGADVVINGSYFEPDLAPTTPLRSAGHALGPTRYASSHGAIVSGPGVAILDLAGRDVAAALAPYRDAMVSYPLLIAADGSTRAAGHDDWLANRSFVAIDGNARIVLGTTHTGSFSLRRLADALRRSSLGLRLALNLDGGPIASQIVRVGDWQRVVHGNAEVTGTGDVLRLAYQADHARRHPAVKLPIVLAATRRPIAAQ